MAKGLTSGYIPLSAVGCADFVVEPIELFNHIHTYGNHPVNYAAGVKTIEILRRDKLVEKSETMGKYFLEGLKEFEHHPIVGEVRGMGLFTSIDLTIDKKTKEPFPLENITSMNITPGIDMTDGSLGQGLSVGVGMALSGKLMQKD